MINQNTLCCGYIGTVHFQIFCFLFYQERECRFFVVKFVLLSAKNKELETDKIQVMSGYPTLLKLKNNVVTNYEGPRDKYY